MSDAIASPAPLGPVTEESTPAPSVGVGPGPSVGRSYDDVSYTHYPSHARIGRNLGQQETSTATNLFTQLHVHAHLAAQHRDTAHSFSCPHPSPPLLSARNDQSTQSRIHVLCTVVHPHIGCVVPSGGGGYGSPCTFCVACREPQSHTGVARGRVAAAPGAACEAARLSPLYFSRNASPKIWNAMNKPA
eukprot:scaffold9250_cov105-Isochrysis_galbana.AAC.8